MEHTIRQEASAPALARGKTGKRSRSPQLAILHTIFNATEIGIVNKLRVKVQEEDEA